MRAFVDVFRFECRYQRKSPLFLIVATVFFLLTFFATASDSVTIGGAGTNLNVNATFTIIQTQLVMSVIGIFAAAAFAAGAVTRDYETRTAEIFFATGVGPRSFLLGRFAGGCLFVMLVGVAGMAGTLVATFMPWLDPERIGEFTFAPYWFSLWAVIVPNAFIVCALFFAAAALGRSMAVAYAVALTMIVAYIVFALFLDPEDIGWAALVDPFGATAVGEDTRYWTVFERNTAIPGGSVVANRLIWVTGALAVLLATTWLYRFELRTGPTWLGRRRRPKAVPAPAVRDVRAAPRFGPRETLAQFLSQLRMDVRGVVRSMPFYVILALGTVNVFGLFYGSINQLFGTPVYPVTAMMLNAIMGGFIMFVLMILVYYAGELVHRERQARVAEILDASPYPNGIMILSKIVALWFIVAALLAVVMLTSIVVQAANGYTNFELGVYLKGLFGMGAAQMYLLCVMAVFFQVLASNKWLGMLAFVAWFILLQVIGNFDFEHLLYGFRIPGGQYSDMNGYGHFVEPVLTVAAYWAAFSVLLLVVAHLLYRRGYYDRFAQRLAAAGTRTSAFVAGLAAAAALAFVTLGAWIFYNTNVLNEYVTEDDIEQRSADYEKAYKQYATSPQPDYAAIDTEVDIFPDERRIESRASARLVNASDEAIDELILTLNPLLTVNAVEIERASPIEADPVQGLYRYRLTPPLEPGDEIAAGWHLSWINEGFPNSRATTRVVENGTFVSNFEIMPWLGYSPNRELGDNNVRRKHDLPPVERLPKLDDRDAAKANMFGSRQRTEFRAVVGTSDDQIAVAPGYLQRDWVDDGRRYFEYEMDAPIWPFFSFSSARYEVARGQWNDVAIEVYHDAKHPYNVDSMIESTQRSLDYFSREFSPYQYRQFRILEFPRYATFAQSFPNTIPYSEAIGFVADLRDPREIDYVFYVTAHEMAHQWWGHQVVSGRLQGMTVPVETLAQYSALMVMEDRFGPEMMRRFLKYELDSYLQSRGGEVIEELPLIEVENQGYIHYRKGSVVMYALKDLIGEDRVNLALRNFLDEWAFESSPFPTSRDLVDEIRAVADPEHQDLITDWFEKITLYDLSVDSAASDAAGDGYEVTIDVSARQLEATGAGSESEVPLSAYLDIGVFPEPGDDLGDYDLPPPLYLEKHLITSGEQTITVRVDAPPARVGIDPYNKMIDRDPDDNLHAL